MMLLDKIEKIQIDQEKSQFKTYEIMEHEDFFMMKTDSSSIHSNRVAYAHTENYSVQDLIKLSKDFFGYKKFSWYLNVERDQDIYHALNSKGWREYKRYEGRYLKVEKKYDLKHRIEEVTPDNMDDYVKVVSEIWQVTDSHIISNAEMKYLDYLYASDRRGGYILAYFKDEPVGYGIYRYSSCNTYLYLSGTAVLERYRGDGFYTSLLNYRLNMAVGKTVLTLAQKDTSSPILEKKGFSKKGDFMHLIPE